MLNSDHSRCFFDETAVDTLRDMTVDVAFIGCDGMSPERGFTTPYREEVAIKRAMMAAAQGKARTGQDSVSSCQHGGSCGGRDRNLCIRL